MMKKLSFAALLLAGACSSGGADHATNAITAGDAVRSQGIQSYAVAGDTITMLDANGALMGKIEISAPTTDGRLVNVTYADGHGKSNELTKPIDGVFKAPVVGDSPEDAILLDAALAPTFAAHQIAFATIGARVAAPLGAASLGNCDGISWAPSLNCIKCSNICTLTYYSDGIDSLGWAMCPRVSCPHATAITSSGDVTCGDGVTKHQYCFYAGGCNAQQAVGYVQCMSVIDSLCYPEY